MPAVLPQQNRKRWNNNYDDCDNAHGIEAVVRLIFHQPQFSKKLGRIHGVR